MLGQLCDPRLPWGELIAGAVVSLLVAQLVRAPRAFFSIFNPRYRKLYGRWHRYGVGFTRQEDGEFAIYHGEVRIFPRPFASPGLRCRDPEKYSYSGRTTLLNGVLYIYWNGQAHPERMLSVYREPLLVSAQTRLVGVKSCITREGNPAANVEILSRSKISDPEILAILGGPRLLRPYQGAQFRLVVEKAVTP